MGAAGAARSGAGVTARRRGCRLGGGRGARGSGKLPLCRDLAAAARRRRRSGRRAMTQTAGDRDVDYLICKQCQTPCYVFEMEGAIVTEATCIACGNEAKDDF